MALAADIVAGVARRLVEHAGLELPAWVVEARASARIAELAVTPEAYVQLITSARGAGELHELVEAVRVGESSLFRHRSQIAALADVVAPALRDRGRRTVRVWSAGCASGEEPYTLAIVLAHALPGQAITILATDVSSDALAAAATATYPRAELDDVPEAWRDAFVVDGDTIRVRPELVRLVQFEQANIMEARPPRACDLVWCRNVLIYFSADARRRAIDRLVGATLPGGFVFVGYSESLRDVAELEPRRAGDAVFYVRRGEWSALERTPVPQLVPQPWRRPPTDPGRRPPAPRPPTDPEPAPRAASAGVSVLTITGSPEPSMLTRELAARLGEGGLVRLTLDLDGADLLVDELAPVIRRARAAARAAGVALDLRATRTGARRWLSRHGLEDGR